jgi:hypothetical protein
MSRPTLLAVAALIATASATTAFAADESDYSFGVGAINLTYVKPSINTTVQNLSNSPYADQRKLTNMTPFHMYKLDGQVFCKAILWGETRLTKAQVMFGLPLVWEDQIHHGATLMTIGVWGVSPALNFQGNADDANVNFEYPLNLPTTWNGAAFVIGFNPVKVVEDRLADYVSKGGKAVDFLRKDDVFEVEFSVNLTGECENSSEYGVHSYVGYTRRKIKGSVFYKGDPRIQYEPVANGPGGILNQPSLPGDFYVTSPTSPTSEEQISLNYAKFPVFDFRNLAYKGEWSGWTTTSTDLCQGRAVTAVAPNGKCVAVQNGCVPAEFESCKAVKDCCVVPLRNNRTATTTTTTTTTR